MRPGNYPCNDVSNAHSDAIVEVSSGPIIHPMSLLSDSSFSNGSPLDIKVLNDSAHVSDSCVITNVQEECAFDPQNKIHSSVGITLPQHDDSLAHRLDELGNRPASPSVHEKRKSIARKASLVSGDKIWDGSLQLNTTTTVCAVASFKSGEKAQEINWSKHIEVKGKVRLEAFESYIQELPHARNRALMVISLCWKVGSSKDGLVGIKEIAKGYKDSKRVGFAKICPVTDLYVCPRSDAIITILARYGFFKGIAAVEEDQNSLIGCVVWRRSQSLISFPKKSERKKSPLQEKPHTSSESSITETISGLTSCMEMKPPVPGTRGTNEASGRLVCETQSSLNSSISTATKEVTRQSADSHDTSSFHASSAVERTLSYKDKSQLLSIQELTEQKVETAHMQNPLGHSEISHLQMMKPFKPDLVTMPINSVHPIPSQMSAEVNEGNLHPNCYSQNSSDVSSSQVQGYATSFTSFVSWQSPCQRLLSQKPDSSSQVHNVESFSKADTPLMHSLRPKDPAGGNTVIQSSLPGPPELPPAIQQMIFLSRRDDLKNHMAGVYNNEYPVMHAAEPKSAAMNFRPTGPALPGPPPLLPQASATPTDDDDLPEFDFNSACGVQRVEPIIRFNRWSHEDTLSREVIISAGELNTPAVPVQKPQNSYSLGSSFSSLQGVALPTTVGVLCYGNSHAAQANYAVIDKGVNKGNIDSAKQRPSCSFLSKRHWDDDDDNMPEWCPPDLEAQDESQPSITSQLPSPMCKPTAEIAAPRPPGLALSTVSFRPPIPCSNQPGILGKCPATSSPAAFVPTRPSAGHAQSDRKHSSVPGLNHSIKPWTRKLDVKHTSKFSRKIRRP